MKPYYEHAGITIYHGDCREVLRDLPDESVHCIVTSPPYWGLRDYGCEGQIGLEDAPVKYVSVMRGVFAEVRRVLRADGTLWLNIGDSYAGSWGAQSRGDFTPGTLKGASSKEYWLSARQIKETHTGSLKNTPGLKPKDLVGIPWMLAFALREDGWYLRQDIIWAKPNPMPESVTDRCTKAHEYIFLLSKSERYYFNQEAIMEPVSGTAHARGDGVNPKAALHNNSRTQRSFEGQKSNPTDERNGIRPRYKMPDGWDTGPGGHGSFHRNGREKGKTPGKNESSGDRRKVGFNDRWDLREATRSRQNESFSAAVNEIVFESNRRSVWMVATEPFPEAHFATFPQDLIKPCILAGCPEGGTVLDPFMGSGTTGLVARKLYCKAIGIELNAEYVEIAAKRLSQGVFKFQYNGTSEEAAARIGRS